MAKLSADDLLRRALLEMMRDTSGRDWPRATEFEFGHATSAEVESHLAQCANAEIHDVDSDTDTTTTGTQVGSVTCTVRCPHGHSASARAASYGNVSFLIERMEQYAQRLIEDEDAGPEPCDTHGWADCKVCADRER